MLDRNFAAELCILAARQSSSLHTSLAIPNRCDQIVFLFCKTTTAYKKKLSENVCGSGDCGVWNGSERQSQEAPTTPSEVVFHITNQAASRVSVHRSFRRCRCETAQTKRAHVVALLLSGEEHQNNRFQQHHSDLQLPHPALSELRQRDQH